MHTFGILYGPTPGSPLFLQTLRQHKDGSRSCYVINGAWPCRVSADLSRVSAPRPGASAFDAPILAVYEAPPNDPLPDDYNEACAVILARAKPWPKAIR
jgi:hypothetical protein